jgi:hypothetical protein
LLRVFGDYGWLIADLLITAGVIALLFGGFRLMTGDPYYAALSTLLLMAYSTGPNLLESISHRLSLGDMVPFYGYRYPRPLVTTLFLLIQLSTMVWAMRAASVRQLLWRAAAVGVSCSVLLQGDLHGGLTGFICATGILAWCVLRFRYSWPVAFKALAAFAGAAVLVSLPFLYQVSQATPELKRRWGTVPIARWNPFFLPHTGGLLLIAAGAWLTLWGLAVWRRGLNTAGHDTRWAQPLVVVLASYIVSVFTLPLSSVLLGQGLQIGHFLDRAMRLRTLLVVALLTTLIYWGFLQAARAGERSRALPERCSRF